MFPKMIPHALIALIIPLFGIISLFTDVSAVEDANSFLDFDDLDKLTIDVRQGDYALVRVDASDETAQKQKEVCPDIISSLVNQVVDSNQEIKLKGKAAELIALCTTNNPGNRRAIGIAHESAIHEGLVDLIRSGLLSISEIDNDQDSDEEHGDDVIDIASKAIGNAAEAIWILTFADGHNHEGFMKANAITALADVILLRNCHHECNRAIMWSAAALQNLAASYCLNDDHHISYCNWEWTDRNELEVNEGVTPLIVDGQIARNLILNYDYGNLLDELLWWICDAGPVVIPHHNYFYLDGDENENENEGADGFWYSWPSRSLIEHYQSSEKYKYDEYSISIVSWAAMDAIKTLALAGPEARDIILSSDICDVDYAVCAHARSPDWLEEEKALDAIEFLGLDLDDNCPPLHDENCTDIVNWVETQDGMTCGSYEENNWCVEFGDLENSDGISANEACCVCGGGDKYNEDDNDEEF